MTESSPTAADFRQAYASRPPWDIGQLQPALADVADQIRGSVLDAGCGTGDAVLFFAARGQDAYGVDFVPEVIAAARAAAAQRGLPAAFLVMDALALDQLPRQFDNVIDCGLFHVLGDADRAGYVRAARHVLRPDGRLWLVCFSEQEPPGPGPRRVSRGELESAFAAGWEIESLEPVRMQAAAHVPAGAYSPGGPHAYRLVARRIL
jgi:cyclopropane fatty-acyl-phospholipid synthase-like methyltransferase